ncbi:hypothetical protein [Limnoglobus roseus]|uniref:Uncharacterized protein n=1 Tax=Limnoglobus roseus TaxID=2598579 RepID=A0A5C1AMR0_9BACT|nr:hypothetical protein [Limnoglobus roseus]QEL19266.1 hypothetical protein PX52LOC_06328 [Limnoglobus roseus]
MLFLVGIGLMTIAVAGGVAVGVVKFVQDRDNREASRREAKPHSPAPAAQADELNPPPVAPVKRTPGPYDHVRRWAPGEQAVVQDKSDGWLNRAYVFDGLHTMELFATFSRAADEEGISQLTRAGRVRKIPAGTTVRVISESIERDPLAVYAVRVDADGDEWDKRLCYVTNEFMYPPKSKPTPRPFVPEVDVEDTRPRSEMDKNNPFRPK